MAIYDTEFTGPTDNVIESEFHITELITDHMSHKLSVEMSHDKALYKSTVTIRPTLTWLVRYLHYYNFSLSITHPSAFPPLTSVPTFYLFLFIQFISPQSETV